MKTILCITVLLMTMLNVAAQETGNNEKETERLRKENVQLTQLVEVLNQQIEQISTEGERGDIFLEQQRFRAAHEQRVFWWQLIISYAMFTVVLVLIIGGFLMSWIQFRHAIAIRPNDTSSLTSDLEISAEKLSLKTTLVGALILAIALAFSALLLWTVYEIKVI